LDHPERRFAAVHVAGTNGKGSVSAMVASMTDFAGYRTGLYTSPHLCRFNERIQLNGEPVPDDVLLPALEEVMTRCPELTFFETSTVTAFVIFARLAVELAVVEVGLGGRLDATNVLEAPRVTAITSIGLDHTDRLGNDLASIASEKAGIVKAGVPVVIGKLDPAAQSAVAARAHEIGAPIVETVGVADLDAFVEKHPPALAGEHQLDNARVAVGIARSAGLLPRDIAGGLRRVRWVGRLETLPTPEGEVVLDAAHNADGARAVARWLGSRGFPRDRVALVFGSMADKDYSSMLAALAPYAQHRVYVAPEGRKAADPEVLAHLVPGQIAADPAQAVTLGRTMVGSGGWVVVTGSIFLVGAVRALLLGLERDPAIAL
jgi:dihydrofolate synthase/folylpolyglutamate synthase